MGEIDATVAGRRRRLACADGEEPHLQRLAAMVDEEARALAPVMGPVSDAQLLLMAGVMLADKLADARSALGAAEAALAEAQAGGAAKAEAAAQKGLFEEEEAAAALDAAAVALEQALALREAGGAPGSMSGSAPGSMPGSAARNGAE